MGFVGSAEVRRLLAERASVRDLTRPTSDRRALAGLDVEVVTGDLTDRDSVRAAVRGTDTLFHVAADYRLWVPDPPTIYAANVEGSRNIILAAAEAGIDRIVYTSSVAVLGLHPDGRPADEETPSTASGMIGHYKRSKFLAEEAVMALVRDEKIPVRLVNPAAPVGPFDVKPTPTGRMILDAAAGRMPAYVDTGLNVVHVDDVAEGHLLALEKGVPGRRYILGAENLYLKEILRDIADLTGGRPPMVRLPHNLIMPVAYLSEGWARLTRGGEPRVTRDGVRMARKTMFFSADRARHELGFKPRPAREALVDAIDWFRQAGYLGTGQSGKGS
ncbi:MAG: NAD-dependent epimerase/dehydratase family protein [Alphaproteobacteria bacterium]